MAGEGRRRRWREVVLNVGLAIASLVVTAEVVLRVGRRGSPVLQRLLYLPGEMPPWHDATTLDELLAMAPFHPPPAARWGGFVLDRHGLATPPYEATKPAGALRVVALGDSFTFDSSFTPQDAMWHRLLGARLAATTGRPVEVVNLGVPAVGPRFALRMFEVEGRRLSPDVVLFGLFLGNDLTDEAGGRGSWLRRWSYLCRFVGNARRLAGEDARLRTTPIDVAHAGQGVPGYRYDPTVAFVQRDDYVRVLRDTAWLFDVAAWPAVEPLVGDAVGTVRALADAVRATGARLVVVVMPDRLQVDPASQAIVRDDAPAGTTYDFDRLSRTVTADIAAAGICAVDLLPALRAVPDAAALWRAQDSHWSVDGNRIAADAVWPELERCRERPGEPRRSADGVAAFTDGSNARRRP